VTFLYPYVLAVAVLVTAAAVAGYVALQRRRTAALAAFGAPAGGGRRRAAVRRHLPYAVLLTALPILLAGLARPEAQVAVPRVAGTVVLAFDVSNSMSAGDVAPSRLAAAQAAAAGFVEQQPDSVDVGVLVFGDQALLTQPPTDDHAAALDEALLTTVAQITGGAYQQSGDAQALAETTRAIDLRLTAKKEPLELTAPFAGAGLLLLLLGALLALRWHGRIV
jgi:hypothetical protein